jgi:putative membrane protein
MFGTKTVGMLESRHPLLVAAAAGLIAGAVTGKTDKFLDRFVSPKQKKRDRRVREASAHEMAGPHFASKILGRKLSEREKKRARLVFSVVYGVGWGLIHSTLRKRFPKLCRWSGLPFAVPFFFACDGMVAPLLKISPNLRRIPWQPSAKEMGNHIAWTAAAEFIHRLAARRAKQA